MANAVEKKLSRGTIRELKIVIIQTLSSKKELKIEVIQETCSSVLDEVRAAMG